MRVGYVGNGSSENGGWVNMTAGSVSHLSLTPGQTVRLAATAPVNLRFVGDGSTVAGPDDVLLPGYTVEVWDVGAATGLSVYAATACTFTVVAVQR